MTFGPDERPRSLQIYGSDPDMLGRAVHIVCDEGLVDHVDLNFGCPAAKVTRKGGGAAVPAKPAAAAGDRAAPPSRPPRRTACPSPPSSGWGCGTTCRTDITHRS